MSKGRAPRFAPRIVALGMQGHSAQAIAQRVECSEPYASKVLAMWRTEGGEPIQRQPRRIVRQVHA